MTNLFFILPFQLNSVSLEIGVKYSEIFLNGKYLEFKKSTPPGGSVDFILAEGGAGQPCRFISR